MSDETKRDRVRTRVRFEVLPDGTVEGDGSSARLAATLRYVCRMGSQIGNLLGDGELERLTTLGSVAVLARISGVSPRLRIKAEVETQQASPAPVVTRSVVDVADAIDLSLHRVTRDLASDWSALISDERRLMGALHDESSERNASPDTLLEVGGRALAVLGALDEQLRQTAVRLDFVRGSVLIVGVGPHALVSHADKFEVTEVVSETLTAVQGLLAGVPLSRARSVIRSRPI